MLLQEHSARPGIVCRVLNLPRSSYYYRGHPKKENVLKDAIQSVAGQYPKYGTRRITQELRRVPHQYQVGRKRI